tara:strand:+ start:743 stop:1708 length:966 start_codon:yes stop_codon:yes gene_type:complete
MNKPLVLVFPGQGSQILGMGQDLYKGHKVGRDVFDEVDESLNQKLSKIIFSGSESELRLTSNTQPALMAVSLAIIRVIEFELKKKISDFVEIVLGHSLGEYSSLCSIGSITLRDASILLRKRGTAMQNSVKNINTKMSAVIGLEIDQVEEILGSIDFKKNDLCEIANDNCPGQIIISGTESGVNEASLKLKDLGARSIIDLNVSAPFHCSLMNQASIELKNSIESTNFMKLPTKFVSNVSANFEDDPQKIKELLIKQVFCRVRWRESILKVKNYGINKIIEVGAGKVLTGINKRMKLDINLENISNLKEIDTFMENNKGIL